MDKLSLLSGSGGMAAIDAVVLARGLQQVCQQVPSGCLVTLCRTAARADDDDDDEGGEEESESPVDPLPHYLSHNSDLNVRVWPLRTGRSEAVTGNLHLEWRRKGRTGRAQFKVEERNVRVFAPGTSQGVL